ncbi:MAG: malonyl-CoA synthase [Pseudomonadota bacterium]
MSASSNPLVDRLLAPLAESDRPLIIHPNGERLSYRALFDRAGQIANHLQACGVTPGERVAVQTAKSAQALALYFACLRAGAVYLPLNPAYTPAEVGYFLEDAEPRLLVADPAKEEALRPLAAGCGAEVLTLDAEGQGSLTSAADQASADFETVARAPDDLVAILYTSGTTGRSKGAMLSQENQLSNALTLTALWRFQPDDVLLHALPIFHSHGLFVATSCALAAGAAMIFLPRFDAGEVAALLPQATAMMGVPTFYTRLLDQPAFTREAVAGMRLFTSGSAPLLAETHRAFEARTGHRILERYGMTEINMSTSNPYVGARKAGTVGLPLPDVDLRIVDAESGQAVTGEGVGVIEVKGPNVFQGYWRQPEKTAAEFRADGFFITGDLAHYDEDGYVVIVGRAKDLIITGGFNVYPKEVEAALDALPGVLESAVIGVPHPDFGEGIVAVVVPEAGAALTESGLLGGLADQLAKFKQPKRIALVESLPRNTMGKVQKKELREIYAESFKAPAQQK